MENALKSDAHNGGEWVRADDSQRYNQILKPLSKLMHANVNRTLYKNLIQGEDNGEDGNVCNCLLALATAAGNEQLWKPLNHAILLSCGHDSRSEIRNAGVGLLLKVLQTLGEEYMVLLPECLPVLSELLEDTDEAISGMAKECVQLGEDLLGEELAL